MGTEQTNNPTVAGDSTNNSCNGLIKIYLDKSDVSADSPLHPVFSKRHAGLIGIRAILTAPSNFPKTGKVRDEKIFPKLK